LRNNSKIINYNSKYPVIKIPTEEIRKKEVNEKQDEKYE